MQKILILSALFVCLVALNGCSNDRAGASNDKNIIVTDAQNTNVNAAPSPSPVENQNANTEAAKTENALPAEVPTYDNAQSALEGGRKYFDADADDKALNAFEQAVKLDPNFAEAHFRLGFSYKLAEGKEKETEKSFKEAIKLYEKQIRKDPKNADAHFYLGRALAEIYEDQKAQKSLAQAVKLNDKDSEFRYELGVVYSKLAQYDEAVRELKKSIELDPENAGRAERELERAEAGKNRVDDAKAKAKAKLQTGNVKVK